MKTLLIVDPQQDFMPGGSLEVPKGDEIIPIIHRIMKKYDTCVVTQDWHPKNHVSFASNHAQKKPFDIIDLKGLQQILWPDHCVQGTKGADFHPALNMKPISAIIRKGTDPHIDSYSGFYDNGHLKKTGLAGYLRDISCKEVHICGLAADVCVYYTILDALKEGFSVSLLQDAVRALDSDTFEKMKKDLIEMGVKII
ncbi:MAG: bifunctional nicotinamidase/pyrazinamidase [Candidatus Marinimicrobia bacterium]|nr:bifunctional nicotinamidase/pyrazinamidase [Candidatus Neomarinimicrobiota bacterium]MDD5582110.1 bifunctional nicotinamidase/pyrazinamidase [Candidatus Neomarinimicrobiota bacterium]